MIINTRPTILSSKLNSISNDKNLEVINAPLSLVESLPFNVDTINLKSRLQENGYYKNIIFTSQASAIFGLANLKELAEMKSFNIFAVGPATKSVIAKAGINAQLKSKCSVLAAANPKRSRFDMTMPLPSQVNMPVSLLSRFDIFFIITDSPDPDRDKLLADRILESHRAGETMTPGEVADIETTKSLEGPIDSRLLKLYIAYARRLRPCLLYTSPSPRDRG